MPRLVMVRLIQEFDDGSSEQFNLANPVIGMLNQTTIFPNLPGLEFQAHGTQLWTGKDEDRPVMKTLEEMIAEGIVVLQPCTIREEGARPLTAAEEAEAEAAMAAEGTKAEDYQLRRVTQVDEGQGVDGKLWDAAEKLGQEIAANIQTPVDPKPRLVLTCAPLSPGPSTPEEEAEYQEMTRQYDEAEREGQE